MFDQTKAIENMLSSARKHVSEHSNIFGLQCFRTGLSGVFGYEVTQNTPEHMLPSIRKHVFKRLFQSGTMFTHIHYGHYIVSLCASR
jgi:hypothetical protein